jgi:hypothetical protein
MGVVSDFLVFGSLFERFFQWLSERMQLSHHTGHVQKPKKKLRMGPAYQRDKETRKVCKAFLSLHLYPADKVETVDPTRDS